MRVYAPAAPAATLVAVPSHQIAPGRNGAVSVWTPTVAGDALAVELYLPPGTSPAGLRVSIPRVSHLAVEPFRASDIGSAWCDVPDAACAADQISAAARAAVAKYLYTSARGATSYCTGTLLNDADRGSQVPYFLTARHCIRSQQQATSMEFYWFFERVECGSDDVSATRQTGGATVLAQDALNGPGTGTDHILLRLNSDPPARGRDGRVEHGTAHARRWRGRAPSRGRPQEGHVGRGGIVPSLAVEGAFGDVSADEAGRHVEHRASARPQGGSSGSGLWQRVDGADYLVGVLTGGSGSCTAGSSYYGRFDQFYPQVSAWLGTTDEVEDSGVSWIARVVLVDAATREELADLSAGDAVVDLEETAVRSFDVVVELDRSVGSLAVALSGAQAAEHVSDLPPHTLFGPAGGSGLAAGEHTVTVAAYSESGGNGRLLEQVAVGFTVTGSAGDSMAVVGLAAAVGERSARAESRRGRGADRLRRRDGRTARPNQRCSREQRRVHAERGVFGAGDR